jgi:hypothetical protein
MFSAKTATNSAVKASFRPHQVGCPYLICWRRWLNPMPWYAAAPNLTAITDDETGSKKIMQNEWEALMVIGASAKLVELWWLSLW